MGGPERILEGVAPPREALFDLAVNRAAEYAERLGLPRADVERTRLGLEVWYLKTRFAYRVPLDEVAVAVASRPAAAGSAWSGGRHGAWTVPDRTPPSS